MIKLKAFLKGKEVATLECSVNEKYYIGRSPESHIILSPLPGISRKHASIECQENLIVLENYGESRVSYNDDDIESVEVFSSSSFYIHPYEIKIIFPDIVNKQLIQPVKKDIVSESDSNEQLLDFPVIDLKPDSKTHKDQHLDFNNSQELNPIFVDVENTDVVVQDLKHKIDFYLEKNLVKTFDLNQSVAFLGRSPQCDFVLEYPEVSRRHIQFERIGNQTFIIDLHSSNGVTLNQKKIPIEKPIKIHSGDEIGIKSLVGYFESYESSISHQLAPRTTHEIKEIGLSDNTAAAILNKKKLNPKKVMMYSAMIAIICFSYFTLNKSDKKELASQIPAKESGPNVEQKLLAEDTFESALQAYTRADYTQCLRYLDKLEQIIPSYKQSSQTRDYCNKGLLAIRKKADFERQNQQKIEMERKVGQVILDCKNQNIQSSILLRACLQPALEIDPSRPEIKALTSKLKNKELQVELNKKKRKEYNSRVARGLASLKKAETLEKNQEWYEAIDAYKKILKLKYPHPKNETQSTAKRSIARIENYLSTAIKDSLSKAKAFLDQNQYKKAVLEARKGLKINRNSEDLLSISSKAQTTLTTKMRKIYQESILDENLGNLSGAIDGWKTIIQSDVPGAEYHEKATHKLKNYEEGYN